MKSQATDMVAWSEQFAAGRAREQQVEVSAKIEAPAGPRERLGPLSPITWWI